MSIEKAFFPMCDILDKFSWKGFPYFRAFLPVVNPKEALVWRLNLYRQNFLIIFIGLISLIDFKNLTY